MERVIGVAQLKPGFQVAYGSDRGYLKNESFLYTISCMLYTHD